MTTFLSAAEKAREALERIADIVDRNLYHQREKVEDVPRIARTAHALLSQCLEDGGWQALSASEAACYHYPNDDDTSKASREAFIKGALSASPQPPAQVPTVEEVARPLR